MAKIQGLDRLKRKLKELPKVAQTMIRDAMAKSADEIVAMMKNLAPVDDGDLRDSIGWTWGKAPKGSLTLGHVKGGDGESTITIYAGNKEAFYARWVEFGTAMHEIGGMFQGSIHPGTRAQPFFYPAYRALKKRSSRRIKTSVTRAAKKVAGGG